MEALEPPLMSRNLFPVQARTTEPKQNPNQPLDRLGKGRMLVVAGMDVSAVDGPQTARNP
jgi:hypothetical protein